MLCKAKSVAKSDTNLGIWDRFFNVQKKKRFKTKSIANSNFKFATNFFNV